MLYTHIYIYNPQKYGKVNHHLFLVGIYFSIYLGMTLYIVICLIAFGKPAGHREVAPLKGV